MVRLRIHVQPNASKTQIVGIHGDALKVKIKAPPEDGRANDELVSFLAKCLSLSKRSVELKSGHASRAKMIELSDVSADEVAARLAVYL